MSLSANPDSPPRHLRSPIGLVLIATIAGGTGAIAADPGVPASVEEAAKVLDLATFPLMDESEAPAVRRTASLAYEAKGDVPKAFEFQKQALAERGWKEIAGSFSSDQSASGTFARDGFRASVSVFRGDSRKPGTVRIAINGHGNVDPAKLPVPPGTAPLYAGPANAMFVTASPVDEAAAACRDLLIARGWQPYGTAGDSLIFKQNAVRLNARVAAAPAQAGKTAITYSTELLSADIPAPPAALNAQYADTTKRLTFDTESTAASLADFYREALARSGWEPTTKSSVGVGSKDTLIFANPNRDILILEMQPAKDILRVSIRHQSAAEVAEEGRRAQAASARKGGTNRPEPKPAVSIALPAGARDVEASEDRIKFTVGNGKAKAAVEALLSQLRKEGWKQDVAALEGPAGAASLSKAGGGRLSINYSDTGILPAEVEIMAIGAKIARAKSPAK